MAESAKIGQIKIGMSVATEQLKGSFAKASRMVNKFASDFKNITKIEIPQSVLNGAARTITIGNAMLGIASKVGMVITGINQGFQLLGSVVGSVFNLVTGLVSRIFQLGKAVGSVMISLVADAQSAQAKFEVLTGSVEKAAKLNEQINAYAARSTIGGKGAIQDAAATMLSFGTSIDKVMPSLEAIGEITAGSKERFQSLTLAMSQIGAAGRLTGQDLLQAVNSGWNPLQQISKETGISIGELKKKMEDGAISSAMITAALMRATQAGGLFYGMNERIGQTINGMSEMIKSKATLAFTKFSDAVLKAFNFQNALTDFNFFVDQIISKVEESTGRIAAFIKEWKPIWWEGVLVVKEAVGAVKDVLFELNTAMGMTKEEWKQLFVDMQFYFREFMLNIKRDMLQLRLSLVSGLADMVGKGMNIVDPTGISKLSAKAAGGIVNLTANYGVKDQIAEYDKQLKELREKFDKEKLKPNFSIDEVGHEFGKLFDKLKGQYNSIFPKKAGKTDAFDALLGAKKDPEYEKIFGQFDKQFGWTANIDLKEAARQAKDFAANQEFIQPYAENDYFHPMGKKPDAKKDQKIPDTQFAGLAFAGSKEARDAILNNKFGTAKDNTEKNTKDTVLALKTTNTLIKKQIDNASSNFSIEEVGFV